MNRRDEPAGSRRVIDPPTPSRRRGRVGLVQQTKPSEIALRRAYELMFAAHGHQSWWPGETAFEVCVGAILTQNTAWTNVERAIRRLRDAGVLSPASMFQLPESDLAELIRPAGYYHVKARRLRSFLRVLVEGHQGSLESLLAGDTPGVRQRLLSISGIGPETADSILLYAGGHVSFVVDAYTRRIFSRHAWCHADASYLELQSLCARSLSHGNQEGLLDYWQDYHAQLVAIGKNFCRPQAPRCHLCPLRPLLPNPDSILAPASPAGPAEKFVSQGAGSQTVAPEAG